MITCTSTRYSAAKKQPDIRNVILMIGDGMGLATISSAMTVSDRPLNITRCKTIGLQNEVPLRGTIYIEINNISSINKILIFL